MAHPRLPRARLLTELLLRQAEHRPDKVSYIFLEDGEEPTVILTFAELDERVRAIAATLQDLQAEGKRAVLLFAPGIDYVLAFYACIYAGVVAVPAYPPDPARLNRTLPRLQAIAADCQAEFVLTSTDILSFAQFLFEQAPDLGTKQWVATDAIARERASAWKPPSITPDTLAFLQYTSGSTGSPKGVMLSHAHLLHNLELISRAFAMDDQTVGMSWLPPYHDMGLIGGILGPLHGGIPTSLMSPIAFLQRPFRWLAAISRFGATSSGGPNFAYDLCIRRTTPEQREQLDLSRWSLAFSGAEPVRLETIEAFSQAFAPSGFRRSAFYPCYGLAEGTLIVSGGDPRKPPVLEVVSAAALASHRAQAPEVEGDRRALIGCGGTLGDQLLRIVDPTTLRACGPNEIGEIWVSGPSVARGYWMQPAATQLAFKAQIADEEGPRYLRTGDLGFLRDGELFVTGRLKDLIIIWGRNVYPQDLERTAEESHGSLRRGCCAAFTIPVGGDERVVVAVEVERRHHERRRASDMPDPDGRRRMERRAPNADAAFIDQPAPFEPQPIVDAIREALVRDHGIELHAVVLLKAGSLPKTSSGKVQRRECARSFASGALDEVARDVAEAPPAEVLAKIFGNVLNLSEVDAGASFFDLGGHSLLATQVISRIRNTLNVELPLSAVFEAPTVASLVERIQQAIGEGGVGALPPRVPLGRAPRRVERLAEGAGPEVELYPMSFAQELMWLNHQLAPDSPYYNVPIAATLSGPLDVAALERALGEVVRRHQTMRTTLQLWGDSPVQVVWPWTPPVLRTVDLRGRSETEREAENQRLVADVCLAPFDLERGPVLRSLLVQRADDEHQLLLAMHHTAVDGWTWALIARELQVLYVAFHGGAPSPLPELPVHYGDYAFWERQSMTGEVLDAHVSYWKDALGAAPRSIDLPTDRPRGENHVAHGGQHVQTLEPRLVEELEAFGRSRGATLFMTMLAALNAALRSWTGQSDLVVGTVVANRPHVEVEALVGNFVNFLALRTTLSENASPSDALASVRDSVLAGYAHQACPYDRVVSALRGDRASGGLYNVALLLQNFTHAEEAGLGEDLSVRFEQVIDKNAAWLDLRLVVASSPRETSILLEYDAALFDADTIRLFSDTFVQMLETFARRPDDSTAAVELPAELVARARAARERDRVGTIAVAATFTAEPIGEPLAFWMRELDLPMRVEFAPYNQVFQSLLDPASLLARNAGGANVVLLRLEDWVRDARPSQGALDLERTVLELAGAIKDGAATSAVPFLLALCPPSASAALPSGLEDKLVAELAHQSGVHLLRTSEIEARYPVAERLDARSDELGRVPYTPEFFAALGTLIARKIAAISRPPYKVIALDCDNTLWRGVCGEDGAEGIELDGPARALQAFMVRQHDAGMLLCLCSKNNAEDVDHVFATRAADMPLAREHIVTSRVNWLPKSENLRAIAEELSLSLDSFIFLDDSAMECAEVQAACPEVSVLELPGDRSTIPEFLEHVWAFDHLRTTGEDRQRSALYKQNVLREQARRQAPTLSSFLEGLGLEVTISPLSSGGLERAAQLTERTNQFNFTTTRRSAAELGALLRAGEVEGLEIRVEDRFGDYGVAGLVLFRTTADALQVDTFLLSCRALGRGVEHRMLARLGALARGRGLETVELRFVSTAKNAPALAFLDAVAAHLRQPTHDGALYRVPADHAAATTPEVAEWRAADEGSRTARQPQPSTARGQDASARLQRIATDLRDPQRILSAIARDASLRPEPGAGARRAYVAPRTPSEESLAAIFAEVLRLPHVSVEDSFFELGGDSIQGIQLVAKLNREGYAVGPRDLFSSPTVAELALAAPRGSQLTADQGLITGDVPLTPAQSWFFEQRWRRSAHHNEALLLEHDGAIDVDCMTRALGRVLEHHDVLRHRFRQDRVWLQSAEAPEVDLPLARVDLSSVPPERLSAEIEAHAADAQVGLDLVTGPLFRVVLFECGEGRPTRLLLLAHSLVVDADSWRVLIDDLWSSYARLRRGLPVELPPKTTSFQAWARRLTEYARSGDLARETGFWAAQLRHPLPLSRDFAKGSVPAGEVRQLGTSLAPELTRALLEDVAPVYRTKVDDLLVTALALAFKRWRGLSSLVLALEHHGRGEAFPDVDRSRTVGRFTTHFPLRLDLPAQEDLRASILVTKERLRSVPHDGVGYGLLRHCAEPVVISAGSEPHVRFRYLGSAERAVPDALPLRFARESVGPTSSPENQGPHLLEIVASVLAGRLQVLWSYDSGAHAEESILALMGCFDSAVADVVAHCQLPDAGGFSPCDFPLARLSRAELDDIRRDVASLDASVPGKVSVVDIYPLTPLQEGMLFHAAAEPDSDVYLEQLALGIEGAFDSAAFERAFQDVAQRHPILRSAFAWQRTSEPHQIVLDGVPVQFRLEDLDGVAPDERSAAVSRWLDGDRARPFDLTAAPPLRVTVLCFAPDHHHVVLSYHHILLDGWSLPLLFEELFTAYAARQAGEVPLLPPAFPYARYVGWLGDRDVSARAFWVSYLDESDLPTPLPSSDTELCATSPAADHVGDYEVLSIQLDQALTTGLDRCASSHQLTLGTLVQAAWGLLLAHQSGASEAVFGATVSGRSAPLPGIDHAIGLFINTIPVRVRLDPVALVADWLPRLHAELVEARTFEHTALTHIGDWLGHRAASALFDSVVVFENFPLSPETQEALSKQGKLRLAEVSGRERTNFPLTLIGQPGERLTLKLAFELPRFDSARARDLLDQLALILERISSAAPGARLREILHVPAEEKARLLERSAGMAAPLSTESLHALFERTAAECPDLVAVQTNDAKLSYRELGERAHRLARVLRERGVRPETVVGVSMGKGADLVVAFLAILEAGGAFLPLSTELPESRLEHMLGETGAEIVLVDAGASFPSLARPVTTIEVGAQPRLDAPMAPVKIAPEALAYVIYTSGSTGVPKGVAVSHSSAYHLASALTARLGVRRGDRILQFVSFAFDVFVSDLLLAFATGATLCFSTDGSLSNPEHFEQVMRRLEVSVVQLPASFVGALSPIELPSLRLLVVGGEAWSPTVMQPWSEGRRFFNAYGPTEAAVCTTIAEGLHESGRAVIGAPLEHARVYILDDDLDLVPLGAVGELCIAGPAVARGYVGRADATASSFVPNPFALTPGERLYRTGDRAMFLRDGSIAFAGRKDGQVKVRGFRVELGEIESAMRAHPDVRDAVVVAHSDGALRSFVLAADAPGLGDSVRQHLLARLPAYMVPAEIAPLKNFPLTTNGKVDRRALERLATTAKRADAIGPRDLLELRMLSVWETVLDRRPIDVTRGFLEQGGSSLAAIRLVVEIERAFGPRFPLSTLLGDASIESLAHRIRSGEAPAAEEDLDLVALQPAGRGHPLFLAHPIGGQAFCYRELAAALGTRRPVYAFIARTPLPSTLEELAGRYILAMRKVQPSGPYHLAGWSFGGVLAFEMARQLEQAEEDVEELFLFDSHLDPLPAALLEDEAALVNAFFRDMFATATGNWTDLASAPEGNADPFDSLFELARARRLVPLQLEASQLRPHFALFQSLLRLQARYRPGPFYGQLVLFSCGHHSVSGPSGETAWHSLSRGGVDLVRMEATHYSLLRFPALESVVPHLAGAPMSTSRRSLSDSFR